MTRNSFISKHAHIDASVSIGPSTIIEDDVVICAHTDIQSHVVIRRGTHIGKRNRICTGVQLGVEPQDYHFQGERSKCIIGDNNVIREYATISRASGFDHETRVGHGNYIMTYVHIAHNVAIGNNTVISSGTQLGGYVTVDDYATIGGLAGVHQFCRIGTHAMLGAMSYLNKDLPPYFLARGNPALVRGVNVTGLQRHAFTRDDIEYIKGLYKILYMSTQNLTDCVRHLTKKKKNMYVTELLNFIKDSRRGLLLRTSTESANA